MPDLAAATPSASTRRPAMGFIMIAVLIDMVSIGLMIPVLPHLVGTFTQSNDEQAAAFLVVTGAFAVANFLGAPVLGALSDRYGRRPVLLMGFAGLTASFFVTAAATALWMLVAVRLFSGAMQANVAIANAYVADITPPAERARRFGALGAMFGIGFIVGPVAGGLLGDVDVHLPFYVAGTLAFVNFCYGWFVLPESLPPQQRRPFEWRRANPVAALQGLAALRGVGALVAVIALASLAQFMLHSIWVLYTKFKFGWGPGQVGWSLLAVGVVSALSQGVLIRHVLKRVAPQRLAVIALSFGALSYLGFGVASQGWMIYAVMALGLVSGMGTAAMQSIVSNAADPSRQGQTMGAVSSLNGLMAVLAPLLALELLRWVADNPPGHWLLGLPMYFAATMMLFATVLAARSLRRAPAAVQPSSAST